jgi:predicted permease
LLLAQWAAGVLLTVLDYGPVPVPFTVKLDLRVLVFTGAVSFLTGIFFGLIPALAATRVDLNEMLKGNEGGPEIRPLRRRLTKSLIIAQVALSLALLIGAGLFLRTLRQLYEVNTGFDRENVLTMWAFPALIGYDHGKELRLYQELLERMNATSGVRSASLSRFSLTRGAKINFIGPRFFETQSIGLVQGREFSKAEMTDLPKVGIISESLARKYYPDRSPIEQRLPNELSQQFGFDARIIGVVNDTRHGLRQQGPDETLYLPYTQAPPEELGQIKLHVRTEGRPSAIVPVLLNQIHSVERDLPVTGIQTQGEELDGFLGTERSLATLLSFFGALALLLASIGLYGTTSYAVGRRTKEIGIRMALGAQKKQILWLVLSEILVQVGIGAAVGIPMAMMAARLIASLLFGVKPTDPLTIAVAVPVLITIALLAGYLPARRATKVDPLVALRYE